MMKVRHSLQVSLCYLCRMFACLSGRARELRQILFPSTGSCGAWQSQHRNTSVTVRLLSQKWKLMRESGYLQYKLDIENINSLFISTWSRSVVMVSISTIFGHASFTPACSAGAQISTRIRCMIAKHHETVRRCRQPLFRQAQPSDICRLLPHSTRLPIK